METKRPLDKAFEPKEDVKPTFAEELLAAAQNIPVHGMLKFEPRDDVAQAHLCYLYLRTSARTIQTQLRQLAALAAFASALDTMSDSEVEIRNSLIRMLREAVWNTANAIESDLYQLDEIASLPWYGSMPGDLCWLQRTVKAAYELLRQKVPS
jgi:hypothetical protein